MLRINLLVIIFLNILSIYAQGSDITKEIKKIVNEYQSSHEFHGNVEVQVSDQIVYSGSHGVANQAFIVDHTKKSRFMIASVSKQFTAAAILLLVQSGAISLDDKYSDYIPWQGKNKESEANWDKFTIRQLLTHSARLTRDIRHTPYSSPEAYTPILSLSITNMLNHHNVFSVVDAIEDGVYSNFGYMLLAYLVEKLSKQNFHDFLKENIFKPLGMKSTGQFHRMFHIDFMSDGYNYPDDETRLHKRCCLDATSFIGSHSLYSDVSDLMIWLNDLTAKDSKILSKTLREEMLTPYIKLAWTENRYGLGVYVDNLDGNKLVWHDGMEYGFLSHIAVIPDLKIKVVVLSNRHDSRALQETPYTTVMANTILKAVSNYTKLLK